MAPPGDARWWAIRAASTLKPATYRCPLCEQLLHAMSEHLLITPEGESGRRRHAHTECVARARRAGEMLTYDEWRATQPHDRSWLSRLFVRRLS
ncbi:MAG TPA: hypothetical protein VF232_03585 [Gaiellaceae bacterium]